MNNIYNNQNAGMNNVKVQNDINEGGVIKKSLMRNISIAIILLVIIYGGYLMIESKLVSINKDIKEEINTKDEAYILLNTLTSKLNFKNSNIEKYSFDLNNEKYNGYAISTVSYTGVAESPFNDELRNSGFVESENNLAEGHSVGLAVYSKDNLICIIKNEAVNPESWGTDNPDYSSSQTFACASKNSK